ncbi:hypothetical protein SZN_01869 [Streptomyces zinciresistens K42]|uniref:Uncharacterized protein n=1 Tax=Streptomyces zinciresistens K42 TaxID=700597 RepID=G2G4H2_9ACTN|nr:DUF6668 family protein [Streptomyces zinciresistens]EGX61647.1 hypothetical protein SZN_01869 [Streptomyces zinciresistens K42]
MGTDMQLQRGPSEPGPEIWVRGPVAPVGQPPPAAASFAPRRFSWVGVHGGAGASTLAAVYGGRDCGAAWPGPAAPRSVLLVARTHASGLAAALGALEVFRLGRAPHGLDLDAVVLVADAPGRLPRPLAERVRVIESVIDVYRVPWVPAWRLGELDGPPPGQARALARLTGRVR